MPLSINFTSFGLIFTLELLVLFSLLSCYFSPNKSNLSSQALVTMIHRLSLAAAPRFPALWPADRATTPAPASEVAETTSLPEGLRPECPTRRVLPCPPLWATLWASLHHSILVSGKYSQSARLLTREIFQLPPSPRLNTRLCHPATPISTEEWAGCPDCSTAEVWRGAESTLPPTRVFRCPQLPARPAPRSSRTRPTDLGEIREGQSPSLSQDLILYF